MNENYITHEGFLNIKFFKFHPFKKSFNIYFDPKIKYEEKRNVSRLDLMNEFVIWTINRKRYR